MYKIIIIYLCETSPMQICPVNVGQALFGDFAVVGSVELTLNLWRLVTKARLCLNQWLARALDVMGRSPARTP